MFIFASKTIFWYDNLSIDVYLTRGNPKIAYGLIYQHIKELKLQNFQGHIVASEISENLQIPYRTVIDVFNQLKDEQIIQILDN